MQIPAHPPDIRRHFAVKAGEKCGKFGKNMGIKSAIAQEHGNTVFEKRGQSWFTVN
jgi:hypothetical protein